MLHCGLSNRVYHGIPSLSSKIVLVWFACCLPYRAVNPYRCSNKAQRGSGQLQKCIKRNEDIEESKRTRKRCSIFLPVGYKSIDKLKNSGAWNEVVKPQKTEPEIHTVTTTCGKH